MARILFVYSNLTGKEVIGMGIASLSAYLKKEGHETFLMDYTWGGSFNDCIKKIKQINPCIVAFSLGSGEYSFCLKLAELIKREFDTLTIFGGAHPTADPEDVIRQEQVDIVCRGEGEQALAELLNSIEKKKSYTNIKNLWVKHEGKVIKNDLRPLTEDLDIFPFVDREIYDFEKYLKVSNGKVQVYSSRGCPFSCSYCVNNFNKRIFKGKYVRFRSPEKIIEEIKFLRKRYSIKSISFVSEVFTADKKWVISFCKLYTKEVGLPFHCFSRTETLDDDICFWLKKAGCLRLQIGIECGNESFRRKVLKRYTTNEQIIKAFKCARNHGIKTYAFNVVGFPFETEEIYKETIELNHIIKPTYLQASIFHPYPGTELYDLCIEKGFFNKNNSFLESFYHSSVLNYPDLTKKQILKRKRLFRYKVLKKYNKRKALITLIFDSNLIYWKLRNKIPLPLKKVIHKFKYILRS